MNFICTQCKSSCCREAGIAFVVRSIRLSLPLTGRDDDTNSVTSKTCLCAALKPPKFGLSHVDVPTLEVVSPFPCNRKHRFYHIYAIHRFVFHTEVHRGNHEGKMRSSAETLAKVEPKWWCKRCEFVHCSSRAVREGRSEQSEDNRDAESPPESVP